MFKWLKRRKEAKEAEREAKRLAAYLAEHPDRFSVVDLIGGMLGKSMPTVESVEAKWQEKQKEKAENSAKPNPKVYHVKTNLASWYQKMMDSKNSSAGHSLLWFELGEFIPEVKVGKWSIMPHKNASEGFYVLERGEHVKDMKKTSAEEDKLILADAIIA